MRLNPKDIQKAMQRFGIQQQEVPASRVIIEQENKKIIFDSPKVSRVNMMGDDIFQISGDFKEEETDSQPEISEEDVETVMEQTGVEREKALNAIKESKGDLAKSILSLKEK
jgi:nascent polypeptide-associated complex subunit alpha